METMNTLNTTDGWEDIVNRNAMQRASARERVAARKRDRKIKKLWLSTCVMAAISLAFVILGAAGAVAGWLATVFACVSLASACIQFCQYLEVKKG